MTDDLETAARRTIQRASDANTDRKFEDWPAADRDAYRTAVALLTLPPLVTADGVRAMVGEVRGLSPQDYADLAASANADRHEGRDWLPRYKLALAVLAQAIGVLDGVCSKLASVWAGKPEGATIVRLRSEANELWLAHLRAIADTPEAGAA